MLQTSGISSAVRNPTTRRLRAGNLIAALRELGQHEQGHRLRGSTADGTPGGGPGPRRGRLDPLDSLEANWQHRHCTGKFSVWPGPSRWLMVLEATTLLPGVTAW
jgi:hypothetical protein